MALGKLERVDLRDIWSDEARDFTPWLASEENLQILGETIGIELELEAQEKNVGPFSADILCRDTEDSSWVLVENQLERTDHKHLGQLLTYAAGLHTVTIIWVAARFTEEHRAALDWLNEITDDQFRFFGLEVELWRIGESFAAPKFNIISKPNDWSRTVSRAARNLSEKDLTPTKANYLNYWTALAAFLEEQGSPFNCRKARPQHWQTFSVGRSGFILSALGAVKDDWIAAELYINHENAKAFFHELLADKDEIENELGFTLDWQELPTKKATRLRLLNAGINPLDKASWPQQFNWFKEKLEIMNRVFRPRVKALKGNMQPAEAAE